MSKNQSALCITLILLLAGSALHSAEPIVFNDNGAWCWFQDERVIIHDGKLIIGSLADHSGTDGSSRWGNVEVVQYDIDAGGPPVRTVLHANLQADDHNNPAFLVLPDNRILAVYAKHGSDHYMRYRISTNPNDATGWQSEVTVDRGVNVTYSNVYRLSAENNGNGRIYNFYRGENYNPNFVTSDDNAQTWNYGLASVGTDGRLIAIGSGGTRPYVRYTSNNIDKIHFISTEAHPRRYSNSIYYGYLYDGDLYSADGTWLHDTVNGGIAPQSLEKLYQGGMNNVAWTTDIWLDNNGYPYIAFSVQMNQDMNDLRYFYARWDGMQWHVNEIAYAGSALYAGESDYTGLVALDPHDPDVVYISADVHPVTGDPLISSADAKRHYELFKGTTTDMGASWVWEYVTRNSTEDNIRPIVPKWDGRTILLWLRGTYTTFTNYDLDVVGLFDPQVIHPDAPVISDHPDSVNVRPGQPAELTVEAQSSLAMNYQWYKVVSGGTDLEVGDDTPTLTLASVQPSDEGQYYCIVTNTAGTTRSINSSVKILLLLVHLPLDNTYTDVIGNGYNATPVGNPTFAAGKYNSAINLDGNDYLSVQNGDELDLFGGGTLSAWIKTSQLPHAWSTLLGKGVQAWRLCQYNGSGAMAFHFNSSGGNIQANGDMGVLDNTWHHVVATYDGQTISLYVDGQLDVQAAMSELANVTSDPVYVGNRSDADRFWQGLVDDVRIYNYALSPEAIDSLYNGFACYEVLPTDLDGDCRVDLDDLVMFLQEWLENGL